MDGTTHMHSQAEALLAEFDAAVENGTAFLPRPTEFADGQDARMVGGGAAYDALVQHVWGRNPTPVEWRQWVMIMRAAGRDDVCYREPMGGDAR